MSHPVTHSGKKTRPFSAPLFFITIIISVAIYLTIFALVGVFFAPHVLQSNLQASWIHIPVFCVFVFANGLFEHPFHRYVLHSPFFITLARLFGTHTHHHVLTHIVWQRAGVKNKYAIVDEDQHESSYFPWYSYLAFAAVLTIPLVCLQAIFRLAPIMLDGYLALAFSICFYEIRHAYDHQDLKKWLPRLEHPNPFLRWFWNLVYSHHIGHHANPLSNMNISGFFGIPVGDLLFGTLTFPKTRYPDGEQVDKSNFEAPRPYRLTRWLDGISKKRLLAYKLKRKQEQKERIQRK